MKLDLFDNLSAALPFWLHFFLSTYIDILPANS